MSRIFFDTNLFIYLMEDCGELTQRTVELSRRMQERRDELVTSTLTLGEILLKPYAMGDTGWVKRYEGLMDSPGIVLVPFERACSKLFAQIRADRSIKPPDAIQLACAAYAKCDLFVTNDDRLSRKSVPGIHFITSLQRAFI